MKNSQEFRASLSDAQISGFATAYKGAMGSDSVFHKAPLRKLLAFKRLREFAGALWCFENPGALAGGAHFKPFGGLSLRRIGLWNFNS